MNYFKNPFEKYLQPMERSAETPRHFLTFDSVGLLKVAFLFNLLKNKRYDTNRSGASL